MFKKIITLSLIATAVLGFSAGVFVWFKVGPVTSPVQALAELGEVPRTLTVKIDSNIPTDLAAKIKSYQPANYQLVVVGTNQPFTVRLSYNTYAEYLSQPIRVVGFKLTGNGKTYLTNKTVRAVYKTYNSDIADLVNYLLGGKTNERIKLTAVGDMMLSRQVGKEIAKRNNWDYSFEKTMSRTKKADITFGNLESPIITKKFNCPPHSMVFGADARTIKGLTAAGFDMVSLANNHFGNMGPDGMLQCYSVLAKNGIKYTGAGRNYMAAHTVSIIERKGVKFGFLAYNEIAPVSYSATKTKPGLAWLEKNSYIADIKRAKKACDVLVVSVHWGTEYVLKQSTRQQYFARLAIDNGASLILGQHPHVVQGVERYKNGFITYSAGNFVFDQMWSVATQQGVVFEVEFMGKQIVSANMVPVRIRNYAYPEFAGSAEASSVLSRMMSVSKLK